MSSTTFGSICCSFFYPNQSLDFKTKRAPSLNSNTCQPTASLRNKRLLNFNFSLILYNFAHIENYTEMDIKDSMRQILEAESKAIMNIPVTDQYEQAVKLIVEQVHDKGGKLVTSGMGKAGQIAMNIATTFCSTGIPAVCLHPSEAQHGDLGILQPDDVMLLLSNSGKTTEIIELVTLARNLYPQLKFIVITGNAESPLAKVADICLYTGGAPEVCPLGLTPTTSTTMMTVMGDVLVVNVMLATKFTREQYALRHHGGYLGHKSRTAEEIK